MNYNLLTINSKVAKLISRVFDPAILGVLMFFIIINTFEIPFYHASILFTVQILLPLIMFVVGIKSGHIDIDMTSRKTRVPYFIMVSITQIIALILINFWGYRELTRLQFAISGIFIIFTIITAFWKISGHAMINTLFIAISSIYIQKNYWLLLPVILPLIYISRLKLGKHNIYQLIAGSLLGLGVIF